MCNEHNLYLVPRVFAPLTSGRETNDPVSPKISDLRNA